MARRDRGDPTGRRPALKRALVLAEIERVIASANALLKRAGYGTNSLEVMLGEALTKHVTREEAKNLQIAHGRIESRRRFKRLSSQPLLEHRPINHLFLDEGGKSAPEATDPPFFSLAGVALDDESTGQYTLLANEIKMEFFGTIEFPFHEPAMREHEGRYGFKGDKGKQREFDQALDKLVQDVDFVAFGTGIRKAAFQGEFVETGSDPYLPMDVYATAISMLLERYLDYTAMRVGERRIGRVTFESQGTKEDAEHQLEFARLLLDGTQWVTDKAFRNWLETGLRFSIKGVGTHPCELADMLARDLYEWIRDDCVGTPKRWNLFGAKAYCRGDGEMGKFGIKVFPDSDIRDRIEKHRKKCGAMR